MILQRLRANVLAPVAWAQASVAHAKRHPERGDMPGWILIVVITALIVFAIYSFLNTTLMDGFKDAINDVLRQNNNN